MLQNIPEVPANRIRAMQVIVFAMMVGVIMFGLIAMYLAAGKPAGDETLAYVAAAFAGVAIPMSFLLPVLVGNGMVAKTLSETGSTDSERVPTTVGRLAEAYQTKTIVGVSLLEAAAFFNLVIHMITSLPWPLMIAGVLVIFMALKFPTPAQVDGWIERRFEELQFNQ
jgi:hypothetical protein